MTFLSPASLICSVAAVLLTHKAVKSKEQGMTKCPWLVSAAERPDQDGDGRLLEGSSAPPSRVRSFLPG